MEERNQEQQEQNQEKQLQKQDQQTESQEFQQVIQRVLEPTTKKTEKKMVVTTNRARTELANAWATLFYVAAVIFVGVGFYKMFAYDNPNINAYVGGDAYNYIINANYADGYFTLAFMCVFIGVAIQIMDLLKTKIELDWKHQTKQDK